MIKEPTGLQHPPDFTENLQQPQVSGCILYGYQVEMVIRKRKFMNIVNDTFNMQTPALGPLPAHILHFLVAVNSDNLKIRLSLQQGDTCGIGSSADIQNRIS